MSDRPLILVVDDEEGIRALLTDILLDLGYDALAVADGESAMAALDGPARGSVEAAIIDLVLPGRNGLDTLRELRRRRPDLPAIISTGYEESLRMPGTAPLRDTATRERFAVLEKPYKIDQLASALQRALGKQ